MSKSLARGVQHSLTILRALPDGVQREFFGRMIAFSRELPQQFDQPLPIMMQRLTPAPNPQFAGQEETIRQLADAVAAWHMQSPLGICLRRSLLRYHFLREAALPVEIVFGARFKDATEGGGIGGHAWLTLDGAPYYENPRDYEGFVEMYVYPGDSDQLSINSYQ